ncbi:MATE family efflux transporter [Polluticaenibacter yanchengensis]|uniref:Multidrug-efflux transporter n=1 Tax=Polluticaenibacter yanchengensis TaxID=3014562 RepID=A0ABT4UPH3_9BACT|nr:MATE family efflux transporter [Chitinophagaceae bacterium LY-5]
MFKEFKNTLPLAIPLILSNITQMLLHLTDSAMVGYLGHIELAASSFVNNVVIIPQVIGSGITLALSPLVAFALGQNDSNKISKYLYNSIWLSLIVGLILVVSLFLLTPMLGQMGQQAEVAAMAPKYYQLMAASLFPMMVFLMLKQFSDGLEYTKTGMVISLVALPVNAFLCWLFIFGNLGLPKLGLAGAGLATLITRTLQAIVMFIIVMKHPIYKPYLRKFSEAVKISKANIKEILSIGIPSSLQLTMESAAFAISGILIGHLGAVSQAAHQIALNCASLTFMASVGLSTAASIRVSNAFGHGNKPLMRAIGKSVLLGGLVYSIICIVVFVAFKNQLPLIFNHEPEVVALAAGLLLLAAIFQISDATQAIGVGLLRGMKDVKKPTLYVMIAYWIIGIPLGYILTFKMNFGVQGMWIGFVTGLTISSLFLNTRFLRKTK